MAKELEKREMNTLKPVLYLRTRGKPFEVDVACMQEPEGFGLLLNFLQSNYNAKIIDSYEGLDIKKHTLSVNGIQFNLVYDDWFGNSLFANTPESEELLQRIGKDLEERLKDLNEP